MRVWCFSLSYVTVNNIFCFGTVGHHTICITNVLPWLREIIMGIFHKINQSKGENIHYLQPFIQGAYSNTDTFGSSYLNLSMYLNVCMPNKGAFWDEVKNRTILASSMLHSMDNKTITNHHRVRDSVKYLFSALTSVPCLLSFAASSRQ